MAQRRRGESPGFFNQRGVAARPGFIDAGQQVRKFFVERRGGGNRGWGFRAAGCGHVLIISCGTVPRAAISPGGAQLAFNALRTGKLQMWVRRLNATDVRPLAGTDGSASVPFWSPDSWSFGFFADRKLKRVEVASGIVQVLCDAPENDTSDTRSP